MIKDIIKVLNHPDFYQSSFKALKDLYCVQGCRDINIIYVNGLNLNQSPLSFTFTKQVQSYTHHTVRGNYRVRTYLLFETHY